MGYFDPKILTITLDLKKMDNCFSELTDISDKTTAMGATW